MTRLVILACLSLLASSCRLGPLREPQPSDLPRPWLVLEEACTLDATGSQVCCGRDAFLAAAQGSVDVWEDATRCRARLTECRSHASTDHDVCLTQRAELQAKLDDPWRSPWLWGVIGLVAGGVLATGIILGVP
jgi:hypothetical protein